jgi:hypothetical protein
MRFKSWILQKLTTGNVTGNAAGISVIIFILALNFRV